MPSRDIRPEVRRFAQAMEDAMARNDHKWGWRGLSLSHLLDRLRDEVAELERDLVDGNPVNAAKEAADVANFAMMIAESLREEADDA